MLKMRIRRITTSVVPPAPSAANPIVTGMSTAAWIRLSRSQAIILDPRPATSTRSRTASGVTVPSGLLTRLLASRIQPRLSPSGPRFLYRPAPRRVEPPRGGNTRRRTALEVPVGDGHQRDGAPVPPGLLPPRRGPDEVSRPRPGGLPQRPGGPGPRNDLQHGGPLDRLHGGDVRGALPAGVPPDGSLHPGGRGAARRTHAGHGPVGRLVPGGSGGPAPSRRPGGHPPRGHRHPLRRRAGRGAVHVHPSEQRPGGVPLVRLWHRPGGRNDLRGRPERGVHRL